MGGASDVSLETAVCHNGLISGETPWSRGVLGRGVDHAVRQRTTREVSERSERMRDAVNRACPDLTTRCRAASTRSPTPCFGKRRERAEPRRPSSDDHRDERANHTDQLASRLRTWQPPHGSLRWHGEWHTLTWRAASAALSIIVREHESSYRRFTSV
jgi:hypothetical protein